jgi:hypothetical protein
LTLFAVLLGFQWRGRLIISMGWSAAENLVVVQDDGAAQVYNTKGDCINTFCFAKVWPGVPPYPGWWRGSRRV